MAEETVGDADREEINLTILSQVVSHVANEAVILARYETLQESKLPHLWPAGDRENFNKKVNRVVEHLGAPPEFYMVPDGRDVELPPADNYPDAAMREAFSAFSRARKSVMRAYIFMAGAKMLDLSPEIAEEIGNREAASVLIEQAQSAFWEHAETAYIRLSSFWDRIGQVLDFAFFNIRKFDQQGFTAIMDRLHNNVRPMDDGLAASGPWKRLRTFQTSNQEDGLQWLLRRRNLVVHSLHLHPIKPAEEGVFRSQHNHIDAAHREKLRPRAPVDETAILGGQLRKAAALFDDFLRLVEMSHNRKIDVFRY